MGNVVSGRTGNVASPGGRAQVRGARLDGHAVVRRAGLDRQRETGTGPDAARRVLRHTGPGSGRAPHHACAGAPEAPTPAGTSSCRPDLLRAPRSAPGWEMAATTTCRPNCAMSCWRSCATALWCRWPGSPPAARSMCCTAAMAPRSRSFADDHVSASADGQDTEQRWREWELELAEDAIARGSADEQLLARLSNRLRDAGAAPAEHASKLARVLGSSVSAQRPAAGLG